MKRPGAQPPLFFFFFFFRLNMEAGCRARVKGGVFVVGQPSKAGSDCKELKMLCAEDEQSKTCWMTAFRLLKVGPGQRGEGRSEEPAPVNTRPRLPLFLSHPAVRDRVVPELQRSAAEEVQPVSVLRTRGEDLL